MIDRTLGEIYLDHYEKFLGTPLDRQVFRDPRFDYSIQVLAYGKVMENCVFFATLGLARLLSRPVELVSPVDGLFEEVPFLLANAGFAVAGTNGEFVAGGYVKGAGRVSPGIAERFGVESALYICSPYGLPPEFSMFAHDGQESRCMYALPIHASELAYLRQAGPSEFERLLESSNADLFSMSRFPTI